MTSSFGDPPSRPDPQRDPQEPEPSQGDTSHREHRQDSLWAREESQAAREASDGSAEASPVSGGEVQSSAGYTEETASGSPGYEWGASERSDEDVIEAGRRRGATRSAGGRARRVVWELAQTLVLAALIFLVVRGVAQNFRVEGPSMEPGLHDGQYLLVNKAVYFKLDMGTLANYIPFIDAEEGEERYLFHAPERGDVIVFRYPRDPDRDFIKRVIGVPGDTVAITDGMVSVNGVALNEPYINGSPAGTVEPTVVPEKSYFVMGDNRPNSSDSRSWGFVPEENIIGKAMFSYWPLGDFGGVGNASIDLGIIKLPWP